MATTAWPTAIRSTTKPPLELPARLTAGLGWLRLRFTLGDSLSRRAPLLLPNANGAWELYLDGQLVRRDGVMNPDPRHVQPNPNTPPPLDLSGLSRAAHVLAVRFVPWQAPARLGVGADAPLYFQRLTEPQFRQQTAALAQLGTRFLVLAGIFGLLTLLHLVFFRHNPARRANLYFALYAGSLALCCGLRSYQQRSTTHFSSVAQANTAQLLWVGLQFMPFTFSILPCSTSSFDQLRQATG